MTIATPNPGTERTREVSREYVNAETGEVVRLVHEEPLKSGRPKDARQAHDEFVFLFPDGVEMIPWAELKGNTVKVLLHLATKLGYNEEAVIWQAEIANELGISPAAVSNAFRVLTDSRLIFRVDVHHYWVDPRIMWRGSAERRIIERDRLIRAGYIRKFRQIRQPGVRFE